LTSANPQLYIEKFKSLDTDKCLCEIPRTEWMTVVSHKMASTL